MRAPQARTLDGAEGLRIPRIITNGSRSRRGLRDLAAPQAFAHGYFPAGFNVDKRHVCDEAQLILVARDVTELTGAIA
jgi:hypothetical protein